MKEGNRNLALAVMIAAFAMLLLLFTININFNNQIIARNTFDKHFPPLDFGIANASIHWDNYQAVAEYKEVSEIWLHNSAQEGLLELGTNYTFNGVPATVSGHVSYSLDFKILPDSRTMTNESTPIFWFGQGYVYSERWGNLLMPLFMVYLNATDNHLYLVFNGGVQQTWGIGGFVNTYQFGSWLTDLGSVDKFYQMTTITVWVDLSSSSFTKVLIKNHELPFPAGYSSIKVADFYKGALYGGFYTGNLMPGDKTNVRMVFDNVISRSGYWSPSITGNFLNLFVISVIVLVVVVISLYAGRRKGET